MDLLSKSLFYFFCIVIVSVYSETSTLTNLKYTTKEQTTYKHCNRYLLLDLDSFMKSFEMYMYMLMDEGIEARVHDAYQALTNNQGLNLTTDAVNDQLLTMTFNLLEKCSDRWEISTVNFKTKLVKEVRLEDDNDDVISNWIFGHYSELHEVSKVIRKSIDNDVFKLVFKTGLGDILIADLSIELFCKCTHETATFTYPKHVTRVTNLPPETATLPTLTEVTTNKLCDKDLSIDYNSLEKKSFELETESRIGGITLDASPALRGSTEDKWVTNADEEYQLFTLRFTLQDKCSGNWEVATVNFKSYRIRHAELRVGDVVLHTWTSTSYFLPSPMSTVIGKSIDEDVFELDFKAGQGKFLISDLYIELFCNCTHEPSTLTIPKFTTTETEVPTTESYMTTESEKCLPTHFINNDTVSNLNVSLVLLNLRREIVGDASPALGHDRWEVPVRSFDEMSLELKILEYCIDPRISSLKFTVEGVFSLSLMIDNKNIIDKKTIPFGKKTFFEEEGPFKGSHIVLIFHLHKVEYFVYGLEVAVCCEYCPNALVIDYNQSSKKFGIDLTYQTDPIQVDARHVLLYGPGFIVTCRYSQTFSLVINILEPCPTAWHFKQFQFGLDFAQKFEVRIGSEIITNSTYIAQEEKFFTEKHGYFPGSSFELIVELVFFAHGNGDLTSKVYDVRLVACCSDLSTGTTREIITGPNI